MKKAKRPRSIFFRIVIACLAILLAGFCVLEAIILTGGRSSKDQSGDALIVLGAQVYHSGPSPVLKQRLQAALDYLLTESAQRQILLFTCQNRERDYLAGRENVNVLAL